MSTAPVAPRAVDAFVQLWAEALSNVLGQLASVEYPMQPTSAEGMPDTETGDVQLTVTAVGNVRGEMSVRVPASSVVQLAKLLTKANTAASQLSADNGSTLDELFRQVAGHVVTAARPKGLEIQLTTVLGEAPTWSPGASGWICSAPGAPHLLQVEWKLSSALATGLVSSWQEQAGSASEAMPEVREVTPTKSAEAVNTKLPAKLHRSTAHGTRRRGTIWSDIELELLMLPCDVVTPTMTEIIITA